MDRVDRACLVATRGASCGASHVSISMSRELDLLDVGQVLKEETIKTTKLSSFGLSSQDARALTEGFNRKTG